MSLSTFSATVCKTFREFNAIYTPFECEWSGYTQYVATVDQIQSGDRTYGWNNNSGYSLLRWIEDNHVPGAIEIPPYWWTWFSISGGGPYYADLGSIHDQIVGERGLTWHSFSYPKPR